jgi:nicotinamidase-related amidase
VDGAGASRRDPHRRASPVADTGAETDVCVLAIILDAVDLGYRVVLAIDALCSSSDATHDALMTLYRTRFSQQIEIASQRHDTRVLGIRSAPR